MGLDPEEIDLQDASRRAEHLGFTKNDALIGERQMTLDDQNKMWNVSPVTVGAVALGVFILFYASTVAT